MTNNSFNTLTIIAVLLLAFGIAKFFGGQQRNDQKDIKQGFILLIICGAITFCGCYTFDTKDVSYKLSDELIFDKRKPLQSMNLDKRVRYFKRHGHYNELMFNECDKNEINENYIEYDFSTKIQYRKSNSNKIVASYHITFFGREPYPEKITIYYK